MMTIDNLPREILEQISDNLENRDVCHFSQANKTLHTWSEKSPQWRRRVRDDFRERYENCYSLLSSQISFARIYALEKARQTVIADADNQKDATELSECSLKINLMLSPWILGPIPVVCGIALLGTVKSIRMALDSGIFGSMRFGNLRQQVEEYFQNLEEDNAP